MFKVTEIIRDGDKHYASARSASNVRDALLRTLEASICNSNISQIDRDEMAESLDDGEEVHHGRASYSAQFRSDLTGCRVSYRTKNGARETGLVLSDQGVSLLVRADASGVQVQIDAPSVLDFQVFQPNSKL